MGVVSSNTAADAAMQPKARLSKEALAFQPDAVEVEEGAPAGLSRLALYGVTLLIGVAATFAAIAEIDEIVVAQGKLVTTTPTIVVQPLETSIVRSVHVAAGDVVKAGQVLATLDATFSQSDVDQRRARFAALDAQVKRLEAEIGNQDYAAEAGSSSDEALQVQLFRQRAALVASQMRNFDQQIAGQASAVSTSRERAKVLTERRDTLWEIEKARGTLYEKDAGSLLNVLTSRDARLEVDSTLAELKGAAVSAEHALARLEADRQAFLEDFRRATIDQLVQLRGERDTVGEELKKMELRRNLVALTAPADAVVLELAQRSIGSVVREAEPLITLVPLGVPLEAEVSVQSRDIGRISVGETARIKFDAYPFQKFGTASGTIRTISRDAFTSSAQQQDAGGSAAPAPYFRARLPLSGTEAVNSGGDPVRLLPGMSVSAEIIVGRRTIASYFLYPILRGLDESIREP